MRARMLLYVLSIKKTYEWTRIDTHEIDTPMSWRLGSSIRTGSTVSGHKAMSADPADGSLSMSSTNSRVFFPLTKAGEEVPLFSGKSQTEEDALSLFLFCLCVFKRGIARR